MILCRLERNIIIVILLRHDSSTILFDIFNFGRCFSVSLYIQVVLKLFFNLGFFLPFTFKLVAIIISDVGLTFREPLLSELLNQ